VYGPPPATAPTIDVPATGQVFTTGLQTVSGTCITGLTVRVFSNAIFGGSSICNANAYSLQTNLLAGRNDLIARQYDGLNQASPDSNLVTVYYNPPTPPPVPVTPPHTVAQAAAQLVLTCDYSAYKAFADQSFSLPCQIDGGVAPYAISIDWGDGTSSVVVRSTSGGFVLEHKYISAGNYIAKISASDKNGNTAFLQMAIVVSGKQDIFSKIVEPIYQCKPDILWPLLLILLVALAILVTSYHLGKRKGEREELEELRKLHRLKNPPK
jgi:hypothetical protein